MSSLLAILLVVNSTKGHHYIFSYPPDPKRTALDKKNHNLYSRDFTVGSAITTRMHEERRLSKASITETNATGESNDTEKDIFAGRDSIFNVDVTFLANALAPELPLCDRQFQLSMDDLTFVGHPVSVTSQHQPDSTVDDPLAEFISPSPPVSPKNNLTTFNPTSPQPLSSPSYKHNNSSSNDNLSADQESCIDEKSDQEAAVSEGPSQQLSSSASSHMTMFHVVYVMSPPDLELNSQVNTLYQNVVLRHAAALRYEQLRCGYVQEEIEKVLGLKEEATNKGTPYDQVMQDILEVSSLARDIKHIYTSLTSNRAAHIIVNDFIDLSLQIPSIGSNEASSSLQDRDSLFYNNSLNSSAMANRATKDNYNGSSLMDIYSVGGYAYDNYPVICPYHTLLLLEDPEEVLKNMPLDASPTLVQLVQILTPTQNLQELHLLLDCSLAQIYRLAAHLIYWRKAKLIHTINTRNIYVVSPDAKLEDIAALEADFKSHIPHLSLPVLLAKLSHAQQYHQVYHVKELKNQYLEAITFLIRKDLVVQLHMYLVLLMPPEKKYREGHETPDIVEQENVISSPDTEWNRLKRLTYERAPKEVADLFERLKPYMNGQHHIEEIIYREGVSRRQLSLVLKYYRDKIVTVYHY